MHSSSFNCNPSDLILSAKIILSKVNLSKIIFSHFAKNSFKFKVLSVGISCEITISPF